MVTAAHAQKVSSDIPHMSVFLKCVCLFFFTALTNYEAVERFGGDMWPSYPPSFFLKRFNRMWRFFMSIARKLDVFLKRFKTSTYIAV